MIYFPVCLDVGLVLGFSFRFVEFRFCFMKSLGKVGVGVKGEGGAVWVWDTKGDVLEVRRRTAARVFVPVTQSTFTGFRADAVGRAGADFAYFLCDLVVRRIAIVPDTTSAAPPRPVSVGDIVVGPSVLLGEWVAAQITSIDPGWKKVGVLDLNWSGLEPSSTDDFGVIEPLVLTHNSVPPRQNHTDFGMVLTGRLGCRSDGRESVIHIAGRGRGQQ